MINDTLQISIAVALFIILIFVLLRYVKPRRNQAEFIIGLLKNLSEKEGSEEKEICSEKRKY
jgi:hypothetical protein